MSNKSSDHPAGASNPVAAACAASRLSIEREPAHGNSHLQGYIDVAYADIVAALGEPGPNDGDKTDAEWRMKVDGVYCTLYNYKDGINYNGTEDGTPTHLIRDWHIGGETKASVDAIRSLFPSAIAKATGSAS